MKEGKLPPQAIELEEAVLGGIMINSEAIHTVYGILSPDAFYKDGHKKIYSAIAGLYNNGSPIDILTVTNQLSKNGQLESVGGAWYITELTSRVSSVSNIEYHAFVIEEMYRRRSAIAGSTELIGKLYDASEDIDDSLSAANKIVIDLSGDTNSSSGTSIMDCFRNLLIEQEKELKGEFSGCKSMFVDLDKIIQGFKNQQMVIIAGRPGMGKTTFAINIAYRLAKYADIPVGFFSLEMSSVELTKKFAAIETQICNSRIKNLSEREIEEYFKKSHGISNLPVFIDDKPGATIDEIRARAIKMKRKNDVKIIFIDYLQLITTKSNKGNREQEISEISRKIKLLSKELDIPIIPIAQLSRQVEQSDPKIPFLHHLRESGSIEQDADMVVMLWRPSYYDYPEFSFDGIQHDSKNKTIVFIRKNRNGDTDKCILRDNLALSSFYDNVDNFSLDNNSSSVF